MGIILGIAVAIVLTTIFSGFVLYTSKDGENKARIKKVFWTNVFSFAALIVAFLVILIPQAAYAAASDNPSAGMGFIGAGIATGLATIGAGYAVGAVGSSALGAVSEDPKILGKTLIFVGLAEGIAIYGLIISIIILGQL